MKADKKISEIFKKYGIVIIFAVIVIALIIFTPSFRKPMNLINVIKQSSVNGIISFGMMLIIITGGIDLSCGSIVALSGVCASLLSHPGEYPVIVPILVACGIGVLFGIINGVGVTFGGIPPFIITLGTQCVARGLALVVSGGVPITDMSDSVKFIGCANIGGVIPILAIYFVILAVIIYYVMSQTTFGRRVYAIGGNKTAARVSGIAVNKYIIGCYTLAGLFAGFAGMLMVSRTSQGSPVVGEGYEMDAVTACVVGGVSMTGGVGNPALVVVGALIIAIIENVLTLFSVDSNWKQVVKGLIIIGAVLLDVKTKGKRE